jgi:glycosyltransferase involved in cell wall biosynthesis
MPPKVSIITPLHNKGPYVAETIQSAMAQTMTDWELIIVENGSTDNGPSIVKGFHDSRIKLLESAKNGPCVARNLGLRDATGEWVLFLDADDQIVPEFLHERMAVADNHPEADLIVGGWDEFGESLSGVVSRRPAGEGASPIILEESAVAAAPWAVHAALVRRSAMQCDPWPEELDGLPSEDTAFWFELILGKRIVFTPMGGALYRIQEHMTRNRPNEILCWIDAVAAVTERNVSVLEQKGFSPSSKQCAAIMRGFEECLLKVDKDSDYVAYSKALRFSEYWLSRCNFMNLAIIIRKVLGTSIFIKTKKSLRSCCK